ncbi:tripeptidyl-peptidase 2 [Selaginella moellendorffii]|uniref:tripeptidyl-peptidase 2 n=1 Tax=Selaginella moellendorffii TaxID=88036 RepID=UPI000D1CCCB5|nr:tripeptidyl-peptidase 2 [Selaginella moellendorffii]|eukprot:XP_024527545.1 tripeptidyl-peptidase 2 [Selaginella moellendorffii]
MHLYSCRAQVLVLSRCWSPSPPADQQRHRGRQHWISSIHLEIRRHSRLLRRSSSSSRVRLRARSASAMPAFHSAGSKFEDLASYETIDASTFLAGLMPKKEIGADRFLEEHPEYDGRGVVIAIFDSGVDPAAAGLQITSDGKPKIIDIVDCTGSGDVDTSKVVRQDDKGCIIGASGATLRLNESWVNPSGDWRVGCKFVYELFPERLSTRLKRERRKHWDKNHREAITDAIRQLQAFDLKYPKPSDSNLKKQREDLQNKVDILQKLMDSYEDKGPIIDAVVWHDGEVWRVALDTSEMEDDDGIGKLEDFTPMTNYKIEKKYGIFSRTDACSFVTNVYDNGDILSIVTDCSPHGTHVAGITAAHDPKEPLLNGIAPGAQLVSCKIGDTRLGSMETGTGLTRALIAVIENKCDLINMSYGEPTRFPDYGRFTRLANEVVHKHGVIFVSSAGNNGPSLTTVGAPGGTSSCILGIGAYVSPVMAAAAHSILEPPSEGMQYTWSSRGPTSDGDLGVCLSAPGGAVAPVPKWTLQHRMLMNGTSMASPCACGGIALVLSSLKEEGRPISPYVVRKALENTAARIRNSPEECLTTGRGLLQVDKAYEYLQKCKELPSLWYPVQVTRAANPGPTMRGIYLRDACESQRASEWTVQVKTKFQEGVDKLDVLAPFEERLQLESTDVSIVKCPEYLLLTHNGRTFNVIVDPTNLKPGVHYAEVVGIDCMAPWRGPLFRVPVTIVKPVQVTEVPPAVSFLKLIFSPGHVERRFIAVPEGATWAEMTVRTSNFDTPRKFFLNAVQLQRSARPSVWESILTLTAPCSKSFAFSVCEGLTMELTISQFWSSGSGSHAAAHVDVEIEFRGLTRCSGDLFLNGADVATRVNVMSPLSSERLTPSITLTRVRTPYRPSEWKLEALSAERDNLPDGRQIHGLTLIYKVNLSEGGKYTPRFPALNGRVYDNEFESQFYMIYDANKRVLSMGDVYPKGVKLSKGEYTIRLLIRHDNSSFLEKLKKAVLFIDRGLEEKNYIKLSSYSNIDGAITGTNGLKPTVLAPGEKRAFYVASPGDDKAPKDAPIGTLLMGKMTLGKTSFANNKGEENGQACPAVSRVVVPIAPAAKNDEKAKDKEPEQQKSPFKKIEEEVRDVKIKLLSLLPRTTKEERAEWSSQANSLKAEFTNYIPLLSEILQKLAASKDSEQDYDEVIAAADELISCIEKDALAKFIAMKNEPEDADAVQAKKDMEMQRDAFLDALCKKLTAIAEKEEQQNKAGVFESAKQESIETPQDESGEGSSEVVKEEDKKQEDSSEYEATFAELRKWVDITSSKYALFNVKRERKLKRYGNALKALNELIQDDSKPPQKPLFELRIRILEEMGLKHWVEYEKHWLAIRFPNSLPLF